MLVLAETRFSGPHSGDGVDGSTGLLLDRNVRCLKETLEDAIDREPDTFAHCGALVSLHPDEATEPTIDAALAAKRPFAVIPCCVFRKLAPSRRVNNGSAVAKYGNFLRYLREKDARIQSFRLPFEGRNVVIFMTAADFEEPPKQFR